MYNAFKIMILWYMYLCCTFCNIHGSINTHAILHKLTSLGRCQFKFKLEIIIFVYLVRMKMFLEKCQLINIFGLFSNHADFDYFNRTD